MSGRGIGAHHSAQAGSVDWFTPPAIIEALGGWESFTLDPATSEEAPFKTARHAYTRRENGLLQPLDGRLWVNPPYTNAELQRFMQRLADHGQGTALIFARTETQAFAETVWRRATAVRFLEGRLHFHYAGGYEPDGCEEWADHDWQERPAAEALGKKKPPMWCARCGVAKANSGAPSVLCAYGADDADILAVAPLGGQFVPLRLPRALVVAAIEPSWREAVGAWLTAQRGPVSLGELYEAFAGSAKARSNPNYRAKIRQTLKRGGFARVGRGQWCTADDR